MSFENPKIKIVGIVFQSVHGNKFYSRYYVDKNDPRADQELSKEESQRKLEKVVKNKV